MLWAALLFSEAGGEVGTCCLPAVSPAVKDDKGQRKTRVTCAHPWPERFPVCRFVCCLSRPGRSEHTRPYVESCLVCWCFLFVFKASCTARRGRFSSWQAVLVTKTLTEDTESSGFRCLAALKQAPPSAPCAPTAQPRTPNTASLMEILWRLQAETFTLQQERPGRLGAFFWIYLFNMGVVSLDLAGATAERTVPQAHSPPKKWGLGQACSQKNLSGRSRADRTREQSPPSCSSLGVQREHLLTHEASHFSWHIPLHFNEAPSLCQMCSALQEGPLGHTHGLHLALRKALEQSLFFNANGLRAALKTWLCVGKSDQRSSEKHCLFSEKSQQKLNKLLLHGLRPLLLRGKPQTARSVYEWASSFLSRWNTQLSAREISNPLAASLKQNSQSEGSTLQGQDLISPLLPFPCWGPSKDSAKKTALRNVARALASGHSFPCRPFHKPHNYNTHVCINLRAFICSLHYLAHAGFPLINSSSGIGGMERG